MCLCFSSCTPRDVRNLLENYASADSPKISLSHPRVEKNIDLGDGQCYAFQFNMEVENAKGHQLEPHLFLYTDKENTPHRMIDGNAFEHAGMVFNPTEDNMTWDTMSILIPLKKLNPKKGNNKYYALVKIYDKTDAKWVKSDGGYTSFHMQDAPKKKKVKQSSSKKRMVPADNSSSSKQSANTNSSSSSQPPASTQSYSNPGPSVMVCPTCAGGGTLPWHNYNTCKTCNGAGVVYW